MIKTIHWYITRDLVRIWVLALFALTLKLTIFSVIEPLRKQQGMTFQQILLFFGNMMPFMLSLTLPVSALFAATITYGRFSQDNEHLACRASGIPTLTLLRPALILGVCVTFLSLWMSNYVAPDMMRRSMAALGENSKNIIYRQLETKHYWKHDQNLIHADTVDSNNDVLNGLVYIRWGGVREGISVDDKVRPPEMWEITKVYDGGRYDVRLGDETIHELSRENVLASGKDRDHLLLGDKVRLTWKVTAIDKEGHCSIKLGKLTRNKVPIKELQAVTKQRDVKMMITSRAQLQIHDQAAEPFIQLNFTDLTAKRTDDGAGNMLTEGEHQGLRFPIDNPMKDRVAWLNWDELLDISAHPAHSPQISRELDKVRRDLRHDRFMRDLADAIRSPSHQYRELAGPTAVSATGPVVVRQYVLKADTFEDATGRRDKFSLGCRLTNADGSPVVMEILEDGKVQQTITSRPGGDMAVGVEYDELMDISQVYITMPGQVAVRTAGDPQVQRVDGSGVGQLPIPPKILHDIDGLDNEEIYQGTDGGRALTSRASIISAIERIRGKAAPGDDAPSDLTSRLMREVRSELNGRFAFSASCLLMVLLGAGLGLVFRGGQFITAFAIAAVPGAIVIISMLMGKAMMQNPKLDVSYGLLAIWGGIVILAVATCGVYVHLARK